MSDSLLHSLAQRSTLLSSDRISVAAASYAEAAISGATQANPVVLTITGHSFNNGDQIFITAVGGMTELNGNTYTVANKTANTVELAGVDGTGFSAYTSGGTAVVGRLQYAALSALATLYATLADLAANATADRSRANHTGTQLAATISDFAAAVQAIAYTESEVNTLLLNNAFNDRSRANHTGTQLAGSISDFAAAVQAIAYTESETDALLGSNATNDRNRANHTGTQLAATISDFNSAAIAATASRTKGRVVILDVMPPGASAATQTTFAGTSTPAEAIKYWSFPEGAVTYLDFLCRLENYNGGGLIFTLPFLVATGTTGTVEFNLAIRRIVADAEDLDTTAHTYDWNGVAATVGSLVGEVMYPTIAFADGADMDSWADGELAVVRVRRTTSAIFDTATGNARLLTIVGKEG